MVCAALTALIRADCESGLVDSPWKAVRSLLNEVLDGAGFSWISVDVLQIGKEGRADIGVGRA